MSASSGRTPAAVAIFVVSLLANVAAYSQEPLQFRVVRTHGISASRTGWSPACAAATAHVAVLSEVSNAKYAGAPELWILDDLATTNASYTACMIPPSNSAAAATAVNPCRSPSAASAPCDASFVPYEADLTPLGKPGEKIARAREEVLSILSSPNACSAWLEQKEPNPASTFRTMSYEIDKRGPDSILRSRLIGGISFIRQPYAARVTQDGGLYSVITINAQGAFYQSRAFVREGGKEEGPITRSGVGDLTVGVYPGATLQAQILALLHEFAHVIDLLPPDGDEMDGTSLQNTNLVLRNCRAEIEARSKANAHVTRVQ